jgi:FlaA1/EpsC-like NDP-sugar epimerase
MLSRILQASRKAKRIATVSYDFLGVLVAIYVAIALRLGEAIQPIALDQAVAFVVTAMITVFIYARMGLYRAVLRYMMLPALNSIFIGTLASAGVLALSSFFTQSFVPRSVPMIYAGVALFLLGGPRVMMRSYFYRQVSKNKPNILIYGAGATGCELAYALSHGTEYHPAAFVDDDVLKHGSVLSGLRVHSADQLERLLALYKPVKVLLAINNMSRAERYGILERLSKHAIQVQSVPSVEDIAAGKTSIEKIRDLEVEDLLGRDQVPPRPELMQACIKDKVVLVTGAGGSIGSELCRQIIQQAPSRLVLYEFNEYNLYRIDQELENLAKALEIEVHIVPMLGSVQVQENLEGVLRAFKVQTIYHSAAYKHVPIVENNIVEGVRNNIFGTWYTGEAAIKAGVSHFVLISTDKAVRPTNIMGATKRVAELVLQGLAARQQDTCFTMVRFGNVLDSSGSVVPLFRDQIRRGGPVTVTHKEITRFFMTVPEAAQLVIQAGSIGHNGQVFVLDMGEPVKILELAKNMIHLMGFEERTEDHPHGEIEIRFSGLRPGEKLFEEMLIGDHVSGTSHAKIMSAEEKSLPWPDVEILLERLSQACDKRDVNELIQSLLAAPTGYQPNGDIADILWRQNNERPGEDSIFH